MDTEKDFPIFDEFGNIVEEIQKEKGLTYSAPKKPSEKGIVKVPQLTKFNIKVVHGLPLVKWEKDYIKPQKEKSYQSQHLTMA